MKGIGAGADYERMMLTAVSKMGGRYASSWCLELEYRETHHTVNKIVRNVRLKRFRCEHCPGQTVCLFVMNIFVVSLCL